MSKHEEKIKALKAKQEQLKARIQKLETAKKSKQRKQDTRRKILIGSYFIDQAKTDNSLSELYEKIYEYLTRDTDKDLFRT